MTGGLRVDGRDLVVPFAVRTDVEWWDGTRDSRVRRAEDGPDLIVLHHTGGEGTAAQVCRTLQARRLSVHYVIEADGTIVQCADPIRTVTLHAGPRGNARGVGIEIVSRGLAPALRARPRTEYVDTVHGRRVRYLLFGAAQVTAARELTAELCRLLGIPLRLPMDDAGHLRLDVLSDAELAAYRGVLGHLHVNARKPDPSPHLLRELLAS